MLFSLVEHVYSLRIRHQYPQVSCRVAHGRAIVDDIIKHYPNARSAVDIGAGYGRLARAMARIDGLDIIAIENMRFSIVVMRILNYLFGARRIHVVFADAFEYIRCSNTKFDIGVAYLGPGMNGRLRELSNKFNVIITLDVEIPGIKATRIIDVPGGRCTHYSDIGNFPNRLFVYEFSKI
ncbi:MAG: class I SAM-dependent methyltransferase [Alphaproteobacteria bacterium]|nr:class I SAM-dependent methyltransferase [Alphaproteobacteria bacterium]